MKAKREEAEEKLAKRSVATQLKKALVEAEEKLQSAGRRSPMSSVSGASTRRPTRISAQSARYPRAGHRDAGAVGCRGTPSRTDRPYHRCVPSEPPDDRRVIPLKRQSAQSVVGDVASAARHVVDAALINGRLRILMVGETPSPSPDSRSTDR